MIWLTVLLCMSFFSSGYQEPIIYGDSVAEDMLDAEEYTPENPEPYSYVVRLEVIQRSLKNVNERWIEVCTGVIYSVDVVLTAAHCIEIEGRVCEKITVRAGTKYMSAKYATPQGRYVKGFRVHANYIDTKKPFAGRDEAQPDDIAILWLQESLLITSCVQLAPLARSKLDVVDKEVTAVGWGDDEYGDYARFLKKTTLQGIKRKDCQKAFCIFPFKVSNSAFCVKSINKQSIPTIGDSGGPLVYNDVVIGLASYGIGLRSKLSQKEPGGHSREQGYAVAAFPMVYTKVYKFINWIEKSIKAGPPTRICEGSEKFCLLNVPE